MSADRGFFKNAAIYGLGSIAMQATSAVLLPLYTHYLSPADYGVLEILERTGQIISLLLLGNGIQMATFSFYCQAGTEEERQRTFSSIAMVLYGILAIGGVGTFFLAPSLASWLKIESSCLVLLGIVVVLLQGAWTFPMALMQARVDSIPFVIANLLQAVTRMGLIIVAVVVFGLGLWGVLGASVLCLGLFVVVLTIREAVRGLRRPDPKIAGDIVRFALPLLPAGLFGLVLTSADRFFLLRYATPGDVGTYSLGFKLANVIPMLAIMPLWKVWTAKLYDYFTEPGATRIVGRVITRIMGVCTFIGLGVCIFGVDLVALLATREYASAAQVIPIITVVTILQTSSRLFDGSLWAMRQTRWKPLINALSATFAAGLLFWLVPHFGSIGAAVALAVASLIHAYATFFITQRVFFVSYEWSNIGIGIGSAVVFCFASSWIGVGPVSFLLRGVLWLGWPVLLWYLGIINVEEKAWLIQQFSKARRYASKLASVGSHP